MWKKRRRDSWDALMAPLSSMRGLKYPVHLVYLSSVALINI